MVADALKRPRKKKVVHVGPQDNGRRMTLDDFDTCTVEGGHHYELANGVIEVSEVPAIEHGRRVMEIWTQVAAFMRTHEDVIDDVAGGSDAKLLIGSSESERHPDILTYTLRSRRQKTSGPAGFPPS